MPSALKAFLAIILLFMPFVLSANVALAQTSDQPDCKGTEKGTPLSAKCFDYRINGQTTLWGSIGGAVGCGLAGLPLVGGGCVGFKKGEGTPLVYNHLPDGGALGGMSSAMIAMYNSPPLSTKLYLATIGQNMGLIPKPAYAQVTGSGDNILRPIFGLWQATRNLAYIFFVFVMIATGLMIMFRQKINPQTVISIQAALPGIVIGLILVTFSYFIAALMVDLMFVGMRLTIELFISSNSPNSFGNDAQLRALPENAGIFQLFGSSASGLGTLFDGVRGQINTSLGGPVGGILGPAVVGASVGAIFGVPGIVIGGLAGAGIQLLIPIAIVLIMLIALVIQIFRLLFALLSAYIQILVYSVAGPLYIMVGSIPGRGGAISQWWKAILANALVFPAVFAGFLFAGVILGAQGGFTTTIPLFGGVESNFIRALLAYGILLGLPAIPEMVRNAFGVKGQGGFAQAALGGFSAGQGVAQTVGGGIGKGAVKAIVPRLNTPQSLPWQTRLARDLQNRFLTKDERDQLKENP